MPASPSKRVQASPALFDPQLIADIAQMFDDPERFVRYVFPWGQAGTSLEKETGPDTWQVEIMGEIRDGVRRGMGLGEVLAKIDATTAVVAPQGQEDGAALQVAVASGHGIGKSALVAWIILWFMSTRDFCQVVVTANTATQLSTKTWRELAKWHKLAINSTWFQWTATRFYHVLYPETWFASAIPWSEHNSEAFAGTHEKHVLVLFDEASKVADKIWEVTEGAMTTPGAMWVCFGNPTQNTGRFAECFGKFKHRWITRQVDSRTAKMANKAKLQQWVDDYGEDHDFVRVRVRGLFPRAGSTQFIGLDLVSAAMRRRIPGGYQEFARIMGVDVARHGDDQSVIAKRQQNLLLPLQALRIPNLMRLADIVAAEILDYKPDAVFIDATGMGWALVDKLRDMNFGHLIHAVQTGETAVNEARFYNKRAELYQAGRDWLTEGGVLPSDPELETDLTSPEYSYDRKFRLVIESKEDMKERGLSSPDKGDAFLLTFASPVNPMSKQPTGSWRERLAGMVGGGGGSAQSA